MEIKIREATAADVGAILEIVNFSILNSTSIYDYELRTIGQQMQWFEEKRTSHFPVFVAVIDNTVAGFGSYGAFRIKAAYQFTVEHSVYVADIYKGKGIGKLLMEKLITTAKTEGFHLMIGCIDADNSGSIIFHKKFGFEVTGNLKEVGYKFDRWLDLVLMQLILK
ncbi:MAG: GNAT family N-acetyltransferase [Flavobacterium sp.]|nr:GNAT family N-acetyltransferase [Flavobacterium sp.]